MNGQEFLKGFDILVAAPGGVNRLRALIYDLALCGKLVAQDPSDEPVANLMARLETERSVIEKAGCFRLAKKAAPVTAPAFQPPEGWTWTRLSNLAHPQPGFAFKSAGFNNSGIGMPLIRIRDISSGSTECFFDGEYRSEFVVAEGDYLVGMDGNFNIRKWTGQAALLNQRVARLIFFGDEIEAPFVAWALQSAISGLHGTKAYTTVQHLSGKQMAESPICLPPIAEQQRIVAKVDELLALCDDLELHQDEKDALGGKARASALQVLRAAGPHDEMNAAWDFVRDEWVSLISGPDDMEDLRSTVLALAVRGRLTRRNDSHEPAQSSVSRAKQLNRDLVPTRGRAASTQVMKGDAALFVGQPESIFVPDGWCVVALSDVARLESGHTPDRKIANYWGGDISWVGIRDARRNRNGLIFETEQTVTQAGINNSSTRLLPTGTVCLSRTASVGYCVILGKPMCTSQDFVNFVCTEALLPEYLQLIFRAESGALKRFAKGAVHLTIYFPEVKAFQILLPPVSEQIEILRVVHEMLEQLDSLEKETVHLRAVAGEFAEVMTSALVSSGSSAIFECAAISE
jgi:type I restriction enzyme, S subunit